MHMPRVFQVDRRAVNRSLEGSLRGSTLFV